MKSILSIVLFASLLPATGTARPLGERAGTTSLGVSVTVVDYCLNSINAARPECAARLNSQTKDSIEPEFVRNPDGSVRSDMPPGLFTVRMIDYF